MRSRLCVIALVLLVAACQPAATKPLPPSAPVVDVAMREYRFDYTPPTTSGRVVFRVENAGRIAHRLQLHPLSEDFPPIDEQLYGEVRRLLPRFARSPRLAPGETQSFAVHLVPGQRYALLCYVTDDQGEVHALKGMNSEFRVPDGQKG